MQAQSLKDRLRKIAEITRKLPLPLDLRPAFGIVESREELLSLLRDLDDYEFKKFLWFLKYLVLNEKDWSLWRFDYEREVFKGESDPLRRLELLLKFFGGVREFELDLEDLEMTLRMRGREEVERFLVAHKDLILSKGWGVSRDEEGIYVFRKKFLKEV